ncbi:MAG: hypothetical protein MUO54_16740, partial [Anaerolineales bacterium]|nr:hypothetical protein [Anaerolineales bacterium]
MQANRLYVYAMLVFLAMTIGEILESFVVSVDPFLIAVILAGGMILLAGFIVLTRFLNKYPIVSMDDYS